MACRPRISVVLPAKNEAVGLDKLLPQLRSTIGPEAEIIVVNDGSKDETVSVATKYGAKVITHPYSMGNGAAIKTGARSAQGEIIVFMDADGQHDPCDIERLVTKLETSGFAMVVGARRSSTHASIGRKIANTFYNRLASFMTGFRIDDLTSGFRAVRARHFRKFLYLLPNGFSYPTTSTMAFFRSGLPVGYVPIDASARIGKSNIRLLHDGTRFLIIILKVGALFSPMRFFLPVSAALFGTGALYYGYTFMTEGRFTNMGALLFLSALSTFLIGLLSEQVSSLHYRGLDEDHRRTARSQDLHQDDASQDPTSQPDR